MSNKLINNFITTNPETETIVTAYATNFETEYRDAFFHPSELEDADGYIVALPYGEKAPILATLKDKRIYVTFERDCYDFEMHFIHLLGDLAEIWYDTEDIDMIREFIKSYNF